MIIAQIKDNKVHWITPWTDWEDVPPLSPEIKLIEIPEDACEGWDYNVDTGIFTSPPEPPKPSPPSITLESLSAQIDAMNTAMNASIESLTSMVRDSLTASEA